MRQFLKELRFAIVDGWRSRGGRTLPVDDSLARTIRESSHVCGGHGGNSVAPRSAQIDAMVAGNDQYVRSFEEES